MRSEQTNVYTVAQVNSYIKNLFARDFALRQIAVRGEVSNCKYHSSGHIYFTLKDGTGVLPAVMFAGNRGGLRFQMREGQQVIVIGGISVYERDGRYQLYAREIRLDGLGDLYQQMEDLKKRLAEMGMFAEEFKRPIPAFASRVGIVTASTGAAIRDIMNISHRRNPYVQLFLYPAIVQGEYAAASIVDGIQKLDEFGVDVIIVGRGGGSIEDLWAFNEECVARAIFDCGTPIISAVGHETDVTIADYVADLRAPTPSAAAELAVYDLAAFEDGLRTMESRLFRSISGRIAQDKLRIVTAGRRLERRSPRAALEERRQGLCNRERQLEDLMTGRLQDQRQQLSLAAARLEAMSPLARMSKGFGFISNHEGRSISSVEQVETGDSILISVKDGQLCATVDEKRVIHRI